MEFDTLDHILIMFISAVLSWAIIKTKSEITEIKEILERDKR